MVLMSNIGIRAKRTSLLAMGWSEYKGYEGAKAILLEVEKCQEGNIR